MLKNFAYIFRGDGFSGEKLVMKSDCFTATIVAVSKIEDACEIAKELQKSGVELIDLCGAFKKEGAEMVSNAVNGEIRIAYVNAEILPTTQESKAYISLEIKFVGILKEKFGADHRITVNSNNATITQIIFKEFNLNRKDMDYICLIEDNLLENDYVPKHNDSITVVPMVSGG